MTDIVRHKKFFVGTVAVFVEKVGVFNWNYVIDCSVNEKYRQTAFSDRAEDVDFVGIINSMTIAGCFVHEIADSGRKMNRLESVFYLVFY